MASSLSGPRATAVAEFFRANAAIIGPVALTLAVLGPLVWRSTAPGGSGKKKEPPSLPDRIPFISNTYQYLTDMQGFMDRVTEALQHSNIVQFRLGPKKVYLLQGQQNIQSLFRPTNDVGSEGFMVMLMANLWNMTPSDIARFAADKSGRLKHRASGSESVPDEERYWHGIHNIYADYMSRTYFSNRMADKFGEVLSTRLDSYPIGEWTEDIRIFQFIEKQMAESAVVALAGPRILEVNDQFIENFWTFDHSVLYLVTGPPKWLDRKPWELRDQYHGMVGNWLEAAWKAFDWDGPDREADWEVNFGSRFAREMAKWFRDHGFTDQSARGFIAMIIFGLNSNSIPNATWILYEVIKDPSLFQAVRAEVLTAFTADPATGTRKIDAQKLATLPLLQSIFNETLRLHLSINLTREVVNPITMEGYDIGKGAMLQAITQIAHYDERTWAVEGHPASEFWAARHLKYTTGEKGEKVPEFSLAGKAGHFVPFGGGTGICPGRFFAKQEILVTLALVVARFDVEFVEWTTMDGKVSDRPAKNDPHYAGAAAMPPDRDMKVRWKRLW